MKEVIQAALSVVVPGQEEYMWNCLRDKREIADVSEEPPAKRKRIDTGLYKRLYLPITTLKTGKLSARFFPFL